MSMISTELTVSEPPESISQDPSAGFIKETNKRGFLVVLHPSPPME